MDEACATLEHVQVVYAVRYMLYVWYVPHVSLYVWYMPHVWYMPWARGGQGCVWRRYAEGLRRRYAEGLWAPWSY